MKLSIITINYNDASGLRKTIESVLCQTWRDYQYVVIDGNSNDGSKDVLSQYGGQLDVAISEPDTGIYNAMNKGASYAKGEYMLFLNSGDELYDNHVLENVFSIPFDEDIVSGRCYDYNEKVGILKSPAKNVSLYTFAAGSLPHPSTFIKQSLFKEIGGYHEQYRIMSDWCFFVEAVIVHNCSYRTVDVTVARFNMYGISTTSSKLEAEKSREFLKELFPRIIPDYLPPSDESISNVVFWIAQQRGLKKKILSFPFKVVNRLLRLRNRLSMRIVSEKKHLS